MKRIIVVIALLVCLGCARQKELGEEALFALNLGAMEDEIDLFAGRGLIPANLLSFTVKDGFFYLLNATNNRFAKFTSHGDILSLIYNPLNNDSFSLSKGNRFILEWPFREPRSLVLDSHNNIYVNDLDPLSEPFESLQPEAVSYNRVVHKFNDKGELLYSLKQEGGEGQSFPFIENLYTNHQDDLIVVARYLEDWQIFWFNHLGEVKHPPFTYSNRSIMWNGQPFSIENIKVDLGQDLLYITLSPNGIEGKRKIWVTSPNQNTLNGEAILFDFPAKNEEEGYQLVGLDKHAHLFFLSVLPTEERFNLYITDNKGKVLNNLLLHSSFWASSLVNQFYLSEDAILSVLSVQNQSVNFYWWQLGNHKTVGLSLATEEEIQVEVESPPTNLEETDGTVS